MQSILTLTVGEFELIHDLFSLLIAGLGASALFFLLSRKEVVERFQPLLLTAGIVASIGTYYALLLLRSWNEAFELAGNSYAASGHFFHGNYRYGDWILTMPLLLIELVSILGLSQEKRDSLLKRLIGAALVAIFLTYLGASNFGEHRVSMRWICWGLGLIPFLYMGRLLCRELSLQAAQKPAPVSKLFLVARNLFLLSWAFYPVTTFVGLCGDGFGEVGLVTFLIGGVVADFISKCGVSFYIYRMVLLSEPKE